MSTNTDTVFYNDSGSTSVAISGQLTSANYPSGYTVHNITQVAIGNTVTSIGNNTFKDATSLTTVTFEDGSTLTTIGNYAFQQSGLTAIEIPKSVTSIGSSAFSESILTSIKIPNSVNSIGDYAFYMATFLTEVTFEADSSVTSIGQGAFGNASGLTAIEIPKSVTSIGNSGFYNTTSLTTVTFEADSLLISIGNYTFQTSGLTAIEIPKSVTSIGNYAFYQTSYLSSVTFQADSTLTTIGLVGAFRESGLTSITIPKSVTSIGDITFQSATNLSSVTFQADSTLTTIGNGAFYSSGLTSIEIPKSVTSIGNYAFQQTNLSSVTFQADSTLTTIGDTAFLKSGFTSIVIPSSVTSIGNNAFQESGIENNTIYIEQPSSLDVIYNTPTTFFGANNVTIVHALDTDTVFYNSSGSTSVDISGQLTSANFPSGYTVSNITRVDIGTTVTSIGNNAFKDATSLTSVTFKSDSSVTSIGQSAFNNSGLTSIEIPKSVTGVGTQVFSDTSALHTVTFEADSSLTNIGNNMFNKSRLLTSIIIPKSVTSIGVNAFSSTSAMTTVTFEADSSVTSIGQGAFYNSGLTSIEIPKSVTTIVKNAFRTNKLTSVTFEADSSLISIGNEAFRSSSLTTIAIPNTVTSIGYRSFHDSSLTTVTFEADSSLISIENEAFRESGLASIEIPNSVTSIGSNAFYKSSLNTVSLTQNLTISDVTYEIGTTVNFFGKDNVTFVRAIGWYLFGSSGQTWSSSRIAWGLNDYNIYQYIYNLNGSPIPDGTTLTSNNWTAIDIIGNDPVLPEYSAYWVKVIPELEPVTFELYVSDTTNAATSGPLFLELYSSDKSNQLNIYNNSNINGKTLSLNDGGSYAINSSSTDVIWIDGNVTNFLVKLFIDTPDGTSIDNVQIKYKDYEPSFALVDNSYTGDNPYYVATDNTIGALDGGTTDSDQTIYPRIRWYNITFGSNTTILQQPVRYLDPFMLSPTRFDVFGYRLSVSNDEITGSTVLKVSNNPDKHTPIMFVKSDSTNSDPIKYNEEVNIFTIDGTQMGYYYEDGGETDNKLLFDKVENIDLTVNANGYYNHISFYIKSELNGEGEETDPLIDEGTTVMYGDTIGIAGDNIWNKDNDGWWGSRNMIVGMAANSISNDDNITVNFIPGNRRFNGGEGNPETFDINKFVV